MTFVVRAQPADGESREIFRHHLGKDAAGPEWFPATISLADLAGQSVMFTFSTETGPAGDGTADWAGWDSPRIIRQPRANP